ncbi:MAG: hypothetical protein DMF89_02825 [Acidobacteria bacterium]|nr:MAG: hypothetical protein DMF89_02825 [Acidobacteriota bacterium]
MPPILALTLSLTFSFALIVYDRRRSPKTSFALWIPSVWLFVLGSRSFSAWMNPGATGGSRAEDLMEGSPVDRAFFLILIALAVLVLIKRHVSLFEIVYRNPWLTLFILYAGLSLFWSDFPEVASRRWIKSFGDPLMALIVLTEADPPKAVATLFKRVAFVALPLSVVFIKYFPQLGKSYDSWTGFQFFTGVSTDKNTLGYLLFAFGLFFFSTLISKHGRTAVDGGRSEQAIAAVFLGITIWLFNVSNAKTALLCVILACLIYVASGLPRLRRFWGVTVIAGLVVFGILEMTLDFGELLIASAGRDTTLTGRTDLWRAVVDLSVNPWVGAGFESFWLGPRLDLLWQDFAFHPNQAHNGYLETYLNLGWVGVIALVGLIVGSFRGVQKRWSPDSGGTEADRDFARFGMACIIAAVVYDITEAALRSMNPFFLVFLIVSMQRPIRASARSPAPQLAATGARRATAPGGLAATVTMSVHGRRSPVISSRFRSR